MNAPAPTPASGDRRDDLSGLELGGYRLLRRLGAGAMAEVYLAEQVSLGRHVAVKTLSRRPRSHEASIDHGLARFEQEARAAASLVHGNIVQIYEIGCDHGVHFIAEEYVAGPSLKSWLEARGPLSADQAVSLLSQVAAALDVAFVRGIVHRDIKPDNLLLTPSGEVKVADFGLARLSHDPSGQALTQEGFTLGTPLYMSPEQVEGAAVDTRSDLYSLGATVYHLLAGRPPFEGGTSLAVALAHVRSTAEPLAAARADLPPALLAIVDRLLAKNPHARFQTPAELREALEAIVVAGSVSRLQGALAWPDWKPAGSAAASSSSVGSGGGSAGGQGIIIDGGSPRRVPQRTSDDLRAATLRLAVAIRHEDDRKRSGRRFWLGTATVVAGLFAVGYALGRNRPRRPPRIQIPR